jgi:hypothetical protein
MGFFNKLFGDKQPPVPEHAVIVRFEYGLPDLQPLFTLGDRLERALAAAGVGDYDGNEIAEDRSDGTLWMYGPDADAVFMIAAPILRAEAFLSDARVTLRYGPPENGVAERVVTLGSEFRPREDGAH